MLNEDDNGHIVHDDQSVHKESGNILTTEHFYLRELTLGDSDALFELCMQPEIRVHLEGFTGDPQAEREKLSSYIEQIYGYYGFGLWGVFWKASDRLAGQCGIEYKMLDSEAIYELGYLLDPRYQGMGYAKEFVSAVLSYCFCQLGLHGITAVIDRENIRSIHLAESLGMKRTGECVRERRNCFRYTM